MTAADAQRQLTGRTIMVTGGTSGIGYQTARMLAGQGARVIITGREADTGETAAATIRQESGAKSITFIQADHATVGGNQDLAEQVRAAVPRLGILVNNVGGLYPARWETADGYEATLAMNFIGPYALTAELLPLLRAGAPSRCISVVSAGFKLWKTDPFTDVQSAEHFISGDAYAHTKLLNVLASLAWARRLVADRITMNLVHPGMSWTQMTQSMTAQTMPSWRLIWPLIRLLQHRGEAGQGRPAGRLRRLLRSDRGLHGPILRGQRHTQPAFRPRAQHREPGPSLKTRGRTRSCRPDQPSSTRRTARTGLTMLASDIPRSDQ